MPIQITPESELGKELAKWEKPYKYEPFPAMMYKANRRPDGVVSVGEARDELFGGQPGAAEAFSATCQTTVKDDTEMIRALELGWRKSPAEAVEHFEEKDKFLSTAAGHRAHEDRNMSPGAKREAAAAEESTAEHIAEVPRKKLRPKPLKKRRGRPPKRAA